MRGGTSLKREVLQHLNREKRKRVSTRELEDALIHQMGQRKYLQAGGYSAFVEVITELEAEKWIRPIQASKQNGMIPPLFNRYEKLHRESPLDEEIKRELLTRFHPSIQTSYYLKHPDEWERDAPYVTAIHHFLSDPDPLQQVRIPLNERSFQLFRDEKWISSSHGRGLLRNIGLTWDDLCCYATHEPFFYIRRTLPEQSTVHALIIENKDTFYSLKELLQQGIVSWGGVPFSLLIYGEGWKITKSFPFVWELEGLQEREVRFYYFGDLDPVGIEIWHQLNRQQEDVTILPFCYFYEHLLQRYGHQAPVRAKAQRGRPEAERRFLEHFCRETATVMQELLKEKYLPQEGLHYLWLKENGEEGKR